METGQTISTEGVL